MVNVVDELPREWAVNSTNVHLDVKQRERRGTRTYLSLVASKISNCEKFSGTV